MLLGIKNGNVDNSFLHSFTFCDSSNIYDQSMRLSFILIRRQFLITCELPPLTASVTVNLCLHLLFSFICCFITFSINQFLLSYIFYVVVSLLTLSFHFIFHILSRTKFINFPGNLLPTSSVSSMHVLLSRHRYSKIIYFRE